MGEKGETVSVYSSGWMSTSMRWLAERRFLQNVLRAPDTELRGQKRSEKPLIRPYHDK